MDNFQSFIANKYLEAIVLKEKFKEVEDNEWNSLTVMLELGVQLGHVHNIYTKNQSIDESERHFDNLGDELSDVLLQLTYLSYLEHINFENLSMYEKFHCASSVQLNALSVLYGQLSEALMEKYGYRFAKPKNGFDDLDCFIKDRIMRMFLIIFSIAKENNIDMNEEFDRMNEDARNFLSKKLQNGTTRHI